MVKGSCVLTLPYRANNPDTYHSQTLSKGDGTVTVDIRYGWDGISVWPVCVGPIHRVRVTNTGTLTWYLRVPRARGTGTQLLTLDPGTTDTYTGAQLTSRGIDTLADIGDMTLSLTPPPA